jgi:hypothetical protein
LPDAVVLCVRNMSDPASMVGSCWSNEPHPLGRFTTAQQRLAEVRRNGSDVAMLPRFQRECLHSSLVGPFPCASLLLRTESCSLAWHGAMTVNGGIRSAYGNAHAYLAGLRRGRSSSIPIRSSASSSATNDWRLANVLHSGSGSINPCSTRPRGRWRRLEERRTQQGCPFTTICTTPSCSWTLSQGGRCSY